MLTVYKIALALMVGLALIYAFQSYYPEFMAFFSNAFPPVIAGVAVVVSGISLQKYWRKIEERFSRIWLLFIIGLFFWFVGESVWMGYTLIWNVEVPYPSIADAFWIAGYIPFFFALYFYVKTFSSVLSKKILAAIMGLAIILALAISFTLITPVVSSEEDMLTLAVDFAYPLFDVALLSVSFLGLLIFINGKLGKSWLLINLGIFMDVCGDILFSYTTLQETYYGGHFLELFYHFGYIFFLLAFYIHAKEF
ncbi:MAG: hypothetical protein QHH17_05475 [Candidatus Bathyarchaeota archaeon]|nr:hypothetical protein [Candidatus Bathyarchaeota archaeon]